MDFATLHRNFANLIESLDKLVLDSAMELKSTMADLNVKQLEKGIGYDGELIDRKYESLEYAKLKRKIGSKAPEGTPDLKLTGAFHSGIEAVRKDKAIVMWSTDEKTAKLDNKYPKALGLSKKSITELKPDLTEVMIKKGRLILHKK
jgi:hypothetical protein